MFMKRVVLILLGCPAFYLAADGHVLVVLSIPVANSSRDEADGLMSEADVELMVPTLTETLEFRL